MPDNFQLLKESFSTYLSKPQWDWTWYVTQTFDPQKVNDYPRLAEHSWRFFLNLVGNEAMMTYGFVFAEPHKNGRMHWHALVHVKENLLGQPRRKSIFQAMGRKYGYCEIYPYMRSQNLSMEDDVATGVARYLTKYVVKESAVDHAWWDFGGKIGGKEADVEEIVFAQLAPVDGEHPF